MKKIIISLAAVLMISCAPSPNPVAVSPDTVKEVMQAFSQYRLEYSLQGKSMGNEELLYNILKERGLPAETFFEQLKANPELYKMLFPQ